MKTEVLRIHGIRKAGEPTEGGGRGYEGRTVHVRLRVEVLKRSNASSLKAKLGASLTFNGCKSPGSQCRDRSCNKGNRAEQGPGGQGKVGLQSHLE